MRKILFAALAAMVMFASCDKDNNNGMDADKQSILVKFPSNVVPENRSVEAPATAATETTLSDVVVFLLNGTSVVETHDVTDTDILTGYKKFESVPSTVNGVMVVANIPTAEKTALKAQTTVAAIEKYPFTITSQSTAGIMGKVLMGKDDSLAPDTNPDDPIDTDTYKKAEIELNSITARFEIGNVTAGTGIQNVKMEGVWINNYLADGSAVSPTINLSDDACWDITPSANTSGSATVLTPVAVDNAYSPAEYYDEFDASVDGSTKVYAYQLFAGSYVPHIVMLVSGQYDNGNYFLGWLTFNYFTDDADGTTRITAVEGNKIYKVGLSGITVNAKDITIDPELKGFDLGVKCTIAPWTVVNITPGIE